MFASSAQSLNFPNNPHTEARVFQYSLEDQNGQVFLSFQELRVENARTCALAMAAEPWFCGDILPWVPAQHQSVEPLLLIRQELPLGYRRSLFPSLGGETELLQLQSLLMITPVRPHHEAFPKIHRGGWMGLATPHIPF